MQFRLHFATVALLVGVALGAVPKANGVVIDERAALAGRQKIRRELAEAMSNGHITRMDQYNILLHAKEVLPPEDIPALERTLVRLASAQTAAGRPNVRVVAETDGLMGEVIPPGKRSASPDMNYEEPGEAPRPSPIRDPGPGDVSEPCCDDDCPCCDGRMECCRFRNLGPLNCLSSFELSSAVEAFKGPMDVEDSNGNFGIGVGLNGSIPVAQRLGIGFQAGTNVVMSDFHGTLLNGSHVRTQDFTSAGFFQRIPGGGGSVDWGFTYDWLFDEYYDHFTMGQWRVKLAWEINAWNEIGMWTTIADHGASGVAGGFDVSFRPMEQGNLYWRHSWLNDADLTARIGMAQNPGAIVFGLDGKVPISPHLALFSNFTCISPSVNGNNGSADEVWNVTVGLVLVPGGFHRASANRFAPILPVADNGSFAIREVQ